MSKKVLITGSAGYIGNALVNYLSKARPDLELVLVDNHSRMKWVSECGGCSLTEYLTHMPQIIDLVNYLEVKRLIAESKPDVIIHLASQPSAPYSERNFPSRLWTQTHNLTMLSNILCAVKDANIDPNLIVTTTTGIPGAPNAPIFEDHMPNLAGSSYHVSRGFDSGNLQLAARQWRFRILELRTAIVYGTRCEGQEAITRFDWDFYFGTVINRFALSAKMGEPITIYGKGEQKKPYISLLDICRSLESSIDLKLDQGHEIMNQFTECLSIVEIAGYFRCEVRHIPNPRVENEEHQMDIRNDKFLRLLGNDIRQIPFEISPLLDTIDISLLPKNWKDVYAGKI